MDAAKRSDWKNLPLPEKHAIVALDRLYSAQEMVAIGHGVVPMQMEDKWFIFCEGDEVFFHRSWTGKCVYVARFEAAGDGGRLVEARINRDPGQDGKADDDHDTALLLYVIDVVLLRREATFPSDQATPEAQVLQNWSVVGRAMLGEHPGEE